MATSARSAALPCSSCEARRWNSRATPSSTRSPRASCRSGCGAACAATSAPRSCRLRLRLAPARHRAFAERRADMMSQLQALNGGTASPIVRPAWNDMVLIKRILDIGAQSLLVPFVQNAGGGASARSSRRAIRRRACAASPQHARQPLRPGEGLSEERGQRDLRAGAGRDPRGAGADRGHRLGRRHRRRVHRPERSRGLVRPHRQSGASRGAGGAGGRGEAAEEDRQARRHPHAQRGGGEEVTSTGATPSSRSEPTSGCLARNADALAKRFKHLKIRYAIHPSGS